MDFPVPSQIHSRFKHEALVTSLIFVLSAMTIIMCSERTLTEVLKLAPKW